MLHCRMYEQKLPSVDELVIVKVIKVEEQGATCQLLEYDNLEGMLPCTQYSKHYVRSIRKLIKPGRQYVLSVMNVDTEKNYIDLSKKHVTKEEIEKTNDRFKKSCYVHTFLSNLARHNNIELVELYTLFGWPLYKEYDHAYNGLELIASHHELIQQFHLNEPIIILIYTELDKKFAPKPITYITTVEVSCAGLEGVNAVREALVTGQNLADELLASNEETLEITVVKPPEYNLTIKTINQELAKSTIAQCTALIQSTIAQYQHSMFNIKT